MAVKKKTVRTAIGTRKTVKVDHKQVQNELAGICIDAAQLMRAYQNKEYGRAKVQHRALVKRTAKVRL